MSATELIPGRRGSEGALQDAATTLIGRYKAELGGISELMDPSLHAFARLLEHQRTLGAAGDIMEIGVFRAGTASLLASLLGEKERLFLIDPFQDAVANRRTIEGFAKIKPEQLVFHVMDSMVLNKWRERVLSPALPLARFVHIDGEHSYDAVYSDIDLGRRYLARAGLIVIDDVFNMNSACCTHAMFDYLRDQPLLQLVAMGFRKAYLCESRHLAGYRRFFLGLPEALASSAGIHVRLCFNSFAHERSYVTFDACAPDDPHYQVIGKRFEKLAEAQAFLESAF